MKIGTPLKFLTPGDRERSLTTLKKQDGYFGVKGTSMRRNFAFPKISQDLDATRPRHRISCLHAISFNAKGYEVDVNLGQPSRNKTLLKTNTVGSSLENQSSNLRPISKRDCLKLANDFGRCLDFRETDMKTTEGQYFGTENTRSTKHKAYMRMLFSRSSFKSHDSNFDEDYISFDDQLFSRYLNDGGGLIEMNDISVESHSAAEVAKRFGLQSSKCRLRKKYADVNMAKRLNESAASLVKYGKC